MRTSPCVGSSQREVSSPARHSRGPLSEARNKGVLPFVHAEGADPARLFTANLTLPHRCLVLAQEMHCLAADAPLALFCHVQVQFGGSAEVVGVMETAALAQDLA